MAFESIAYTVENQVATIKFNRPERRNAMDTTVFRELLASLDAAESDPEVRAVILTGEGSVFCSGQNMKFTINATVDSREEYQKTNHAAQDRLRRLEKPVVARVQGHALGGGTYLAVSCDLVVAAKGVRFGMREIHAGDHSGGAMLFSVGLARSKEMNILGRFVEAEEAESWGLINKCVPMEELDAAVKEYTDQLIALPPLGLKYSKIGQNLALDLAGFAAHRQARVGNPYLFLTEDGREAKRAFIEKRKPVFKGR